jgi:hypothetical protein
LTPTRQNRQPDPELKPTRFRHSALALVAILGLLGVAYQRNELPFTQYGNLVWNLRLWSVGARREALQRLKLLHDTAATSIVTRTLRRDSDPFVREDAAAILAERHEADACAALAAALESDGSEVVVFTAAASLAQHGSPCAAVALDAAAAHRNLLVIAGGFAYYLGKPSPMHDELLAAAFVELGGPRMGKALKASGRPPLIRIVEEEERAPVKIPKFLRVGDGTSTERAIIY